MQSVKIDARSDLHDIKASIFSLDEAKRRVAGHQGKPDGRRGRRDHDEWIVTGAQGMCTLPADLILRGPFDLGVRAQALLQAVQGWERSSAMLSIGKIAAIQISDMFLINERTVQGVLGINFDNRSAVLLYWE